MRIFLALGVLSIRCYTGSSLIAGICRGKATPQHGMPQTRLGLAWPGKVIGIVVREVCE